MAIKKFGRHLKGEQNKKIMPMQNFLSSEDKSKLITTETNKRVS